MKKGWIYAGLGLLAVAGGTYYVIKKSKKQIKEAKEAQEENEAFLKDQGFTEKEIEEINEDLTPSKMEEEQNLPPEERIKKQIERDDLEISEKIYKRVIKDSSIPVEAFDYSVALTAQNNYPAENIIHVRSRYVKGINRNVIDFVFQVPTSAITNEKEKRFKDGYLSLKDFTQSIKGKFNREKNVVEEPGFVSQVRNIITDPENTGGKKFFTRHDVIYRESVEGYVFTLDKWEDGTVEKHMFMVPEEVYKNNPYNGEHTRVVDYIKDIILEEENGIRPKIFIDGRWYTIMDYFVGVQVSIVVQDARNFDGLNINSGCKIFEEAYNDLVIGDDKGSFKYDYILVYEKGDSQKVWYKDNESNIKLVDTLEEYDLED